MNLIEFNDKLLVNNARKVVSIPSITQEDVDEFRCVVNMNNDVKTVYDASDNLDAFVATFPSMDKVYKSSILSELFYASKLGFYVEGIPSKLLYILNKLFKEYGTATINDTLNRGFKLLKPFINDIYVSGGQEFTLKEVIESMANTPIKLLTSSVRKVKATNCYEVFVPEINRVAFLPGDIANVLPYAECEKIRYKRGLGLVIGEIVVRTMNNRIGITKDDFDLRECV